jgi:hypothetical protein
VKNHTLVGLSYVHVDVRILDCLKGTLHKSALLKVRVKVLLSVGPAESRRMHCSLPRLIVLTPCFDSPVHLHRRSTSDGVRDLSQRKEELWARNDQ